MTSNINEHQQLALAQHSKSVNGVNHEHAQDAFDVDQVRSHFPGLAGDTALLNNASGTVVLLESIERYGMVILATILKTPMAYLHWCNSSSRLMRSMPMPGGSDAQSMAAINAYRNNKLAVASFINASPDEISFGQSTTCLFRLLGLSLKGSLNNDCEIVCSTLCHEASASAWIYLAREVGVTIKWWSPNQEDPDDPRLSVETLKPLLTPKTRIVTCNHVSNVVGSIHPIREIADVVHDIPNCMLIVDGVACVPHRPVDVKALDVDFYCFSWYKVFGPHMGTLYGSRKAQDRYMTSINHFFIPATTLDGKLHLGMPSFELQIMGSPIVRHLQEVVGWENIIRQETQLAKIVLDYLLSRPLIFRVFGRRASDPAQRVSIITFEVRGRSSGDIVKHFNSENRFRIVYGECLAPRPTRDVLRPESSDGLIRVSFVHYNTVAEAQAFCRALDGFVS